MNRYTSGKKIKESIEHRVAVLSFSDSVRQKEMAQLKKFKVQSADISLHHSSV